MKHISRKTNELLDNLLDSMIQDWELDKELIHDCFPLKKPYRNQAGEALQTIETRMKKKLKIKSSIIGVDVVSEAAKLGVFKTKRDVSEGSGIQLLFRGSVLGIRNVLAHNKPKMEKEEAIKIILFADYLLKLFETLCTQNKIKPKPKKRKTR